MKFCEYQAGKFVNPQFIVRVLIECDTRTRMGNLFNREELRRRMEVRLEIQGDAVPARVDPVYLEQIAKLLPTVTERLQALEEAMTKAHVISTFCRFPLAA
jgi:hypothetical protein